MFVVFYRFLIPSDEKRLRQNKHKFKPRITLETFNDFMDLHDVKRADFKKKFHHLYRISHLYRRCLEKLDE